MKILTPKVMFLAAAAAVILGMGACVYITGEHRELKAEENSPGWIVNRADCICGLDDPRLLSHPAVVDHPRCMNATPEMKKMQDEHIDPTCPQGIQLKAQAADRVRAAAEKTRVKLGNCSVWKQISNRDGRPIPDVTTEVIAGL